MNQEEPGGVKMSHLGLGINYDPEYCEPAPYIYYHRDGEGYIRGGEYKTHKEAFDIRMQLIEELGPCTILEEIYIELMEALT
tara:strand:- start:254 stop:499 length:246 start_codon:yes stop_codon:yes gene_type:complete